MRGYAFLGGLSAAVALGAFFLLLGSQGWEWGQTAAPTVRSGAEATTVVFLSIVILQVGNAFACRTQRTSALRLGLLSNRFLLWGIAFELLLAAALIYLPFLQPLFGTAPLAWYWWVLLGSSSAIPEIASLAPAEAVILWGADPREDTAASCGRRPAQNATRLSVGNWPAGQRMAEVEARATRAWHFRSG